MSELVCRRLDLSGVNWAALDRFADRTIFQTREWLEYIAETQGAEPVIAELRQGSEVAGYFSGCVFTRFGIRILGSPFPGWTTPYVGFNFVDGASPVEALEAVEKLAFGELKCLHLEISDPHFTPEEVERRGFHCGAYTSYQTDLRQAEEEIFKSMDSACRRCIRKAEKSGVVIEEAHDLGFADEFYAQLVEVMAKQGLVPPYGVERVRALIRHLEPTGRLLLVRARDPEGRCIATGIFPGMNKIAQFWGNASHRWGQILRPNEAIQWYAIRYWKRRGAELYDWGGGGSYKEKYGCVPYTVPWFSKSRYKVLASLRNEAQRMFRRKQRLMGWLKRRGKEEEEAA